MCFAQALKDVERSLVLQNNLRVCNGTLFLPSGALFSSYGFGFRGQTYTRAHSQAHFSSTSTPSGLAAFSFSFTRSHACARSVRAADVLVALQVVRHHRDRDFSGPGVSHCSITADTASPPPGRNREPSSGGSRRGRAQTR